MLEFLLNKVSGLRTCNFIKKRLQRSSFPGKFAKSLRTPFCNRTHPVVASEHVFGLRNICNYCKMSW